MDKKESKPRQPVPVSMVLSNGSKLTGKPLQTHLAIRFEERRKREDRIYRLFLRGVSPDLLAERFNTTRSYITRVINQKGQSIAIHNFEAIQKEVLKQFGALTMDLNNAWDFYSAQLRDLEDKKPGTMVKILKGTQVKEIPREEAIHRVHERIAGVHAKFFDAVKSFLPKQFILHDGSRMSARTNEDLDEELRALQAKKQQITQAEPVEDTRSVN